MSEVRTGAFQQVLWEQASKIAHTYAYTLKPVMNGKRLEYIGTCVELPAVFGRSEKAPSRAAANVAYVATLAIATMLERGETPPEPENKRV